MSPNPYLKYRTFLTLPLSPPPDTPLLPALQPENFTAGYLFVCFGSLEQRPVLTHGVARHSPLNVCPFFPHRCFQGPLQGDSLWPLGAFCWNVHSVWPCPSVNGIVKADSCLTSPCKQPSPFPFLLCSEQSWEESLPRQSGVAVRAADESNWKKLWKKKKVSKGPPVLK